jgi:L-seryl-tRNA(Ser) seleniumtransferase
VDPLVRVRSVLDRLRRTRIRPVINATGVIVHTNFGRSPLAAGAVEAAGAVAAGYSNLEFDLASGERGGRAAYVEEALAVLCGAEAATVVNNCAAALVLALRHFARTPARNEVLISRGELVQIGGGFRVPEILEASGAVLREVGTTNRTTIEDYRRACDPGRTAIVLRVHRSNFYMGGFVESAPREAVAALAREHGVPLVEDIGSGAVFDTSSLGGGEREPTPAEAIAGGADLVTFSGDKLLGGPQAGVIAGAARHVAALKKDPLFRALRCDKLVLTVLQATVDLLLSEDVDAIPVRRMMGLSFDELRKRAERMAGELEGLPLVATVGVGEARVGGGSLPRTTIESVAIDLRPTGNQTVDRLAEALRLGEPPVIGRVAEGAVKLDLRTVFPWQDDQLVSAIRSAAGRL